MEKERKDLDALLSSPLTEPRYTWQDDGCHAAAGLRPTWALRVLLTAWHHHQWTRMVTLLWADHHAHHSQASGDGGRARSSYPRDHLGARRQLAGQL